MFGWWSESKNSRPFVGNCGSSTYTILLRAVVPEKPTHQRTGKGPERVLFCRITQCLIPGSSGSAARGLLGLHNIKTEIGKRKLYLLGRIINLSSSLAYRKLFIRKLIKWKWRQSNSTMSGFIPDIMKLLVDVNLLGYVTAFLRNDKFSAKIIWKKIVKKAVYESDHYEWVDKIERKNKLA